MTYCLISLCMICTLISVLFVNKKYFTHFENSLDKNKKEIYKKIKLERLNIYIFSSVVGLLSGIMLFNGNNICTAIACALFLQNFIYCIFPKSKYMLEYVETRQQASKWLDIYLHMKSLTNYAIIVGLLLYIFLIKMF